jgi:hypothetical protein
MLNQEHLDILNQGVEAWNRWREENPNILPNLSGVNLANTSLVGINLIGTDLNVGNLSGANLSEALLSHTNFIETNLSGTNFTNVTLYDADFRSANLSGASFSNAYLMGANLSGAKLNGADFSNVEMRWAIFVDIDMSMIKGLETITHIGPSGIGIDTIYRSQGKIPEVFLRGIGVPDSFITYARSLINTPIDYFSCFISYSSKDESFAKRLHADLQSNGVRCWFAREDLKWGETIRPGIDEAIRFHDKLLLILSRSSVASGWVEREVKTALAKERKEKRTVLFPIRIDKAVFESPFDWATEIRHERNIGDFTRWKNHDDYQKAFNRLLRDLKAEA